MLKKVLLIFVVIVALGIGFLLLLLRNIPYNWGHHFDFINELNIEIDSLEISVCDERTMLYAHSDSHIEGNIGVPEEGSPCDVNLKIFSNNEIINLEADSFDCYNCDGYHQYILQKTGARYEFLH